MIIKYQKEKTIKEELTTPEINTRECYLSGRRFWVKFFIWFFFCDKYKCFYYLSDDSLEIKKIDKNWLQGFEEKIKGVFENYKNVKTIEKSTFENKLKEFIKKV